MSRMITITNTDVHPIMGPDSTAFDFASVSMDKDHLKQLDIQSKSQILSYHNHIRSDQNAKWLIGGYLEPRALYQSNLFVGSPEETRDIHLGLDIWGEVSTPIYAPLGGTIHSFAYNDRELDYGYTLIIEHQIHNQRFHTLYGHLSSRHFDQWSVGSRIIAGELIADFGSERENGGWLPHLHFQIILDMEGNSGDYPGVSSSKMLPHYRMNCPDPHLLIKRPI